MSKGEADFEKDHIYWAPVPQQIYRYGVLRRELVQHPVLLPHETAASMVEKGYAAYFELEPAWYSVGRVG